MDMRGEMISAGDTRPLPAGAHEWIHLLPAGLVSTNDGRGPYKVPNAQQLATTSLLASQGRLPIDESHATDLAAPNGQPAPARGWIVDLQARVDGLWGRVEWTKAGAQLLSDRAYRFISPVIRHTQDGTVTQLLRASLTNVPNLIGLTALNQEQRAGAALTEDEKKIAWLTGHSEAVFAVALVRDRTI
jgi:phage I-like protein